MTQTVNPKIAERQKTFDIKYCELDFISQGKDIKTGRDNQLMRVNALYFDGTYINKVVPCPVPFNKEDLRNYDISNRFIIVNLAFGDAFIHTRTFELVGFVDRAYGIEIEGCFDPVLETETEHVYVSCTQVTKFDKDFQIKEQFKRPKYTLRWAPSKEQIQAYS